MRPTHAQLLELLRAVEATEPREIDCDEFLARVGAFVEGMEREDELLAALRWVCQHAEICTPCREELEALLELHLQP